MPHKLGTASLIAGMLVALLAVSGCAPAVKHAPPGGHPQAGGTTSPSTSAVPSATPTPTPTAAVWPPPLPANAFFQISATVTAPGNAKAYLVETVWKPGPITTAQIAVLNSQCKGETDDDLVGAPWLNNYAGSWAISATLTATLDPSTMTWDNSKNGVLFNFTSSGAFTGDFLGFEAACSPGFIKIPGTVQAVGSIQGTNPSGQNYGWAGQFAGYGFDGGKNWPGPDFAGGAFVSGCHVQLSPDAATNATAAKWAAEVLPVKYSCDYEGASVP